MQGIPLLNPVLSVEAVGFGWRPAAADLPDVAEGVLVTPWFMSLLRLPAVVSDHAGRVGQKSVHRFGAETFEFIGAHDPAVGFHEACTLFSAMAGFGSQAQARETAEAVLAQLRSASAMPAAARDPVAARRSFLLGRGSPTGSVRP